MAEIEIRAKRPQRRTGQLSGIQIMFAVILAVGLLLAINFSSRIAAGKELFEAYDSITLEITALYVEQTNLLAERDNVLNDSYVEQWARDRGKMILPGEKLVIPVPSGSIAEATPATVPIIEVQASSTEPEPWELWWQVFFDDPPPRLDS